MLVVGFEEPTILLGEGRHQFFVHYCFCFSEIMRPKQVATLSVLDENIFLK